MLTSSLITSFFPKKNPESDSNGTKVDAMSNGPECTVHPGIDSNDIFATSAMQNLLTVKGISLEETSLFQLEINYLHHSWFRLLSQEIKKDYFKKLKKFLAEEKKKKTIFPPDEKIYYWSHLCPFEMVEVVILGQDPYHNVNQAMGLAFSVPPEISPPPSLINMYKELELEYKDDPVKFTIPNHGSLENWAKQGVLLLNASLSVSAHEAASHANRGWEEFTDKVITLLNNNKEKLVFLLWGSHAQKKGSKINKNRHLILKAAHPSPLSASKGFFGCNHFKKTNEYLVKNHKRPINWQV